MTCVGVSSSENSDEFLGLAADRLSACKGKGLVSAELGFCSRENQTLQVKDPLTGAPAWVSK